MLFKEHMDRDDHANIDSLLRASFPSEAEASLVISLHARGAVVAEHSLWQHGAMIGYVAYTPVTIEGSNPGRTIWALGPMAIDPDHQGAGHGLRFLEESFEETHADAIVVLGHRGFYEKLGFRPAAEYGLKFGTDDGIESHFMAIECWQGALAGVTGRVIYDQAFYQDTGA